MSVESIIVYIGVNASCMVLVSKHIFSFIYRKTDSIQGLIQFLHLGSIAGIVDALHILGGVPNPMKASFLLIAIFSLLVACAPGVSAEVSDPHSKLSGDAPHEYLQYLKDLKSNQYLEYLKQNNPYNSPVMYYRPNRRPDPYPCPPCGIPAERGFSLSPHWTGNGALRRSEPPVVK
jgi:hypothetical protein